MKPDDVARLHDQYVIRTAGPIAKSEGKVMLREIERHQPRSFIEVGTSSGLSTGLIAHMLHDNGGEHLVSVDLNDRYYRDDSKATGFLAEQIYTGDRVRVDLRSPATSEQVPSWDETFEMGFVDGSHQHPWPLLDTLFLRTRMTGPMFLFHHDLILYKTQPTAPGVGPKYLFDQFPESHRTRYQARRGNLFSLDLTLETDRLEDAAIEAFWMPWTTLRRMGDEQHDLLRGLLSEHYSQRVVEAFDKSRALYARPPKRPQPSRSASPSSSASAGQSPRSEVVRRARAVASRAGGEALRLVRRR